MRKKGIFTEVEREDRKFVSKRTKDVGALSFCVTQICSSNGIFTTIQSRMKIAKVMKEL